MTRSQLPHPVTRALIDMHRGLHLGLHAETCRAAGVAIEAALTDRLDVWQAALRGTPEGSHLYEAVGAAARYPNGQPRPLEFETMIRLVTEHLADRLGGRPGALHDALRTVQRARNAAVHPRGGRGAAPVPAEDVVEATWAAIAALYEQGRQSRDALRQHTTSLALAEARAPSPPSSPRSHRLLAWVAVGCVLGGVLAAAWGSRHTAPDDGPAQHATPPTELGTDPVPPISAAGACADMAALAGEEPILDAARAYCEIIAAFNNLDGDAYFGGYATDFAWYNDDRRYARASLAEARSDRFDDQVRYSTYVVDDLRPVGILSSHDEIVFFDEGRVVHRSRGCMTHNKAIRMRRLDRTPHGWVIDAEVSAFSHRAWPDTYAATKRFFTAHAGSIIDTCSGLEWWAGHPGETPPAASCGGPEGWHVDHDDDARTPAWTEWRRPSVFELRTLFDPECGEDGDLPLRGWSVLDAAGEVRLVAPDTPLRRGAPQRELLVRRAPPEPRDVAATETP